MLDLDRTTRAAEESARKDRSRCTYDLKVAAVSSPAMRKRLDVPTLTYCDAYIAAWWDEDDRLLRERGFSCVS